FAGAIAAAVVEQAPDAWIHDPPTSDAEGAAVFTLSATSKRALRTQIERYQSHLADRPAVSVKDLCYTGNVGRAHFSHRMAGAVRDRDELATLLRDGLARLDRDKAALDVHKV